VLTAYKELAKMYQPSRTHFAPPERCLVVIAATTGLAPSGLPSGSSICF
jgi:hypothetical protein